ncbi:MAG: hypothetical protein KAG10_09380 [Methylococcales bacterium]|nr:hypothetical protein [Methylococcales bacterium]
MNLIRLVLVFFFCIKASIGFAQESLEAVLQRMKPKQAIAITYHEKRSMGFFSENKKSHGILYSTPSKILLKVQENPSKILMGIEKDQLYYYNLVDKQRYHTTTKADLPMMASIEVLKGLMSGNIQALKKKYLLNFKTTAQLWTIELTQKDDDIEDDLQALKVIMQGQILQTANSLIIIEGDGDRSEFRLRLQAQGKAVEQTIQKILTVLKDQP